MPSVDYYRLLGVAYDSTPSQIASAFRRVARRLHPDKQQQQQQRIQQKDSAADAGTRKHEEEFIRLQQAYHVLRHADTREQYDAALRAGGLRANFTSGACNGSDSAAASSAPRDSSFASALAVWNEVDLDDMNYEEEVDESGTTVGIYSYPCRCGQQYALSEQQLLDTGIDLYACTHCSLVLRVLFEWQPPPDEDADAAADDDDDGGGIDDDKEGKDDGAKKLQANGIVDVAENKPHSPTSTNSQSTSVCSCSHHSLPAPSPSPSSLSSSPFPVASSAPFTPSLWPKAFVPGRLPFCNPIPIVPQQQQQQQHASTDSSCNHSANLADHSHFVVRRLKVGDDARGHVELLSQLTQATAVTPDSYTQRLNLIDRHGELIHILVVEDTRQDKIVASASLIVEPKFIRGLSCAGHIEDVVVSRECRGLNLGVRLLSCLHEIAKWAGCYKVMLDCSESYQKFYEKIGYKENSKHMRLDL